MAKKLPAKKRGGSGRPAISERWRKILVLLPGYDSIATALPGMWFDEAAADEVVAFFAECLRHMEGAVAGQPFALEPWQQAVVGALFGWKMHDRLGRVVRRYRDCLLLVPRKNGKTPLVAGIGIYVVFCDPEVGQQNYIAASDRGQAGLLFRQAKGMVEQEPELQEQCQIYGGTAHGGQSCSLVRNDDNSFLKVISGDSTGSHGKTSHLIIMDEVHEQKTRELYDALKTSMASENRSQPLFIALTTSDYDRPSVCNEIVDFARRVRDGEVDAPRYLPVIYEALPGDDYKSEATWEKANPNIDVSVSREYLREMVARCEDTPGILNEFKRLHLNIRTQSATVWLDLHKWDACNRGHFSIDGRTAYMGLDLASIYDLAAGSLILPRDDGGWDLHVKLWLPREAIQVRARRDHVDYLTWANAGWIELTDGETIDHRAIYSWIEDTVSRCRVVKIGIDPYNAESLCQDLLVDGLEVEKFHPGMAAMSGPTKEFNRLVVAGQLNHAGNPVLRWMAGNAVVETDGAENMRPTKSKSREKIDGIVASILAVGVAECTPEPEACVYESRGFKTL